MEARANCVQRLQDYFRDNGVECQVQEHPTAYTAQEVAAAEHVSGYQLAKVVVVKADGAMSLAVVPAPYRVELSKLAALAGVPELRLAREEEFEGLFPDCEAGAMPPLGNLYGLDVWVDQSLAEQAEIAFTACDHRHTFRLAYADFERLATPRSGDFGMAPGG